ncbi:hypothetical protein AGLY_004411 [Aphis glycines]|uniref:RNA-directed DNA polymerase n=1 Tax=Aphis glycines TaxID=307491 RepID=A0A6G0TY29_APHGL|nr:hypothetical protein AGLY_004411 [Aphis glycines]
MTNWYDKWRIKINQNQSSHTTFTLKKEVCPTVTLNNTTIPTSDTIKYLGLNLDKRLTWKNYIRTKRLTLNARMRMLSPLISKNNKTNIKVKLLIYKTFLKLIWTYGIQFWGSAKISNTNKIQIFQNLALRRLSNAPPYVSNLTLHNDFCMKTINEEAQSFYLRFRMRLLSHQNPLIKNLSSLTLPGNQRRRLKKKWCRDLQLPI